MNPFLDESVASQYENWYIRCGCNQDSHERNLLAWLLTQLDGVKSIIEIGCGTGHFARWLAEMRYRVTGLDSSPVMLHQARRLGGSVQLVEGDAQELPFKKRSFDVAALITTLEFVNNPELALAEAARVSRCGILLGVMNRDSPFGWRRRRCDQRLVWQQARTFSPHELQRMLRAIVGDRLDWVKWRTTRWPLPRFPHLPLPWGGFIGMLAKLNP
ncbi:MAG TPA: class I SAM-dependent methyltransferase [Pirellulaceae bacterium]|nr:class I SAM-dependent methyltransferase [Pirellulaceae bacterium]